MKLRITVRVRKLSLQLIDYVEAARSVGIDLEGYPNRYPNHNLPDRGPQHREFANVEEGDELGDGPNDKQDPYRQRVA